MKTSFPCVCLRFCSFVLLLILFLASIASAEWYKDYEAAMDLMKKGRTGEAISRLESAIAQKDQEGLNIKFYGMKFDDYLPHYFLGKAYYSQKDYSSAIREFEISTRQGQIQRNQSYFQSLTDMHTLAKAQSNPSVPTQEKPKPLIPTQEKPKPAPTEPEPAPLEVKKQEPEPKKLEPEPKKKKESEPAVRIAEQQKKEPVIPKEIPEIKPEPIPSAEEQNLLKMKSMIKDGARKYFQGDFDSAIVSFSNAIQMSPGEFSAQFLLGCSYAAKYLLSGSVDRDSYNKAAIAFQQSRKINPNHPLSKSNFISPAVREIYEKS